MKYFERFGKKKVKYGEFDMINNCNVLSKKNIPSYHRCYSNLHKLSANLLANLINKPTSIFMFVNYGAFFTTIKYHEKQNLI